MPKLTLSVRIAAASLLLLGAFHAIFWIMLAFSSRANLPTEFPFNYFFPLFCAIAAAGILGIVVALGLFRARNWARIAAIALAALVAFFCVISILVPVALAFGFFLPSDWGIDIPSKTDLIRLVFVYFFVFALALWWIFLFSRKSVAAQFSGSSAFASVDIPKKPACPPPIALLAWLMIISSALSALSWPLILGKIPAMLFTNVFSLNTSKWIWAANNLLFAACGVGLLRLQRWSYTGAIALHAFWLVSLFVSQLSPSYDSYLQTCINALEIPQMYPELSLPRFPHWLNALVTAIPTALLIAGLFYYRRSFLQAAADAQR